MLVEPAIQVNFVVHAPAPELHARDVEIGKQRHPDREVGRGLLGCQAARWGKRQERRVGFRLAVWPVVVRP
jgi:hypothetical protein